MLKITLTPTELKLAKQISKGRGRKKGSKRFSKHSEADTHLIGMMGEFAFGKATGLQVQTDVSLGGDDGVDFLVNERSFQVKTRDNGQYSKPDLLCRPKEALANYYILAEWTSAFPTIVNLVGWCDHEQLTKAHKRNFGHGIRHIAPRNGLIDIDLLIDWVKEWVEFHANKSKEK